MQQFLLATAVAAVAFAGPALASEARAKLGDPVERSAAGAARDRPQAMTKPGDPGAQPVTCGDGTLATVASGCAAHGGIAKRETVPPKAPEPRAERRPNAPPPTTTSTPPPKG